MGASPPVGPWPGPTLALDLSVVPAPDPTAEPEGFIVEADDGTRSHFLDWGPAVAGDERPGILLVPGFGESAWSWTPVARRLRSIARVVAMDLRGHGLSDAPVEGYEPATLVGDLLAVAEGSGILAADAGEAVVGGPSVRPGPIVLAGHGFGAVVAAWSAGALGARCAGLVLVDGGWEDPAETTDLDPEELLRSLDEPPEVLRSMEAYLADRRGFDPATWDGDQERAAREAVVELPSRRLVPALHPHVRQAVVETMFEYRPVDALAAVRAPIVALAAADDETGGHHASLARTVAGVVAAGRRAIPSAVFPEGHNLMRYRPAEVAAAILALVVTAGSRSPDVARR